MHFLPERVFHDEPAQYTGYGKPSQYGIYGHIPAWLQEAQGYEQQEVESLGQYLHEGQNPVTHLYQHGVARSPPLNRHTLSTSASKTAGLIHP